MATVAVTAPDRAVRWTGWAGAPSLVTLLEASDVSAITADTPHLEVANRLERLRVGMQSAKLSPAHAELVRRSAADTLKAAGFPDPVKFVFAALGARNATPAPSLALRDVEPWQEPVNGADLLDALEQLVSRYVSLPPGGAVTMALWTLHAHALEAAEVSPLLAITSPEKQCGKTTLLSLLSVLVPRPLNVSNMTSAALYRAVEKYHPTLLVDEADTFIKMNDELRGVLNSGHLRSSALVVRCVGDSHEPTTFCTWAAKAIACIGALPDTLEDRAVVLRMQRRAPGDVLTRLRADRLRELAPLAQQAARWAADHLEDLRAVDPDVPTGLNDRAADNWRVLLAMADMIGGTWPARARQAALLLSGGGDAEQSPAILLLADLQALFVDRGADRLASEDIVADLVKREDRPWPEWRHGHPLTVRQLARLLARFGIRPQTIRLDGRTPRGYLREHCLDAFGRYIPPSDPQQPQQWQNDAINGRSAIRNTGGSVADRQTTENPCPASIVALVADEKGENGGEPPRDGRIATLPAAGADLDPDEEARAAMAEGA